MKHPTFWNNFGQLWNVLQWSKVPPTKNHLRYVVDLEFWKFLEMQNSVEASPYIWWCRVNNILIYWLVVEPYPSEKLGVWNSQLNGKICSKPQTRLLTIINYYHRGLFQMIIYYIMIVWLSTMYTLLNYWFPVEYDWVELSKLQKMMRRISSHQLNLQKFTFWE